ncbi:MAG: hypothetical protein U9O94_08285 [Nanoarchaeota archaeon]|nr:hypothetical protein [Nanoarchaeota archaeon]
MKKILLILVMLVMFVVASAEIETGAMSKDTNMNAIQAGRSWQMYSNEITALEHLDENTFATHANWDATNDIDDSGGDATWTWVDGAASTLTQVTADQSVNVRDGQTLQLTYTVSITTPVAGDAVDISVGTICAKTTLPQTAGTHNVDILTTSAGGDFVITIDPAAGTTAGVLVFDDIYLTSKYESPLTISTGSEVSLTIPDEAVELVIDPIGTEVKIESGACWFSVWTGTPISCAANTSITIANDSGGDATVYFFYDMILHK